MYTYLGVEAAEVTGGVGGVLVDIMNICIYIYIYLGVEAAQVTGGVGGVLVEEVGDTLQRLLLRAQPLVQHLCVCVCV